MSSLESQESIFPMMNFDPPSPLSLNACEPEPARGGLNIDTEIVDEFLPPPILSYDPTAPYYVSYSTPVHSTVEALLNDRYRDVLTPGSDQYNWHLNRLKQNREAMDQMRRNYEKASSSSMESSSPSRRFRSM